MTRKAPAFQFYVDDFLAGTMSMSPAEVGVYMRLLCQQWNQGHVTERDTRACGGTREEIRYVLSEKFECVDGKYVNTRLEDVRSKKQSFQKMASERGKKAQNVGGTMLQATLK